MLVEGNSAVFEPSIEQKMSLVSRFIVSMYPSSQLHSSLSSSSSFISSTMMLLAALVLVVPHS